MARVTVDDKVARHNMRARFDRGEDFKSVLKWAQREIEKANRANFASQGSASGKPWMPLDNKYARWKLDHHGPLPILIIKRTLEASLVSLRGTPNEIDKKGAWFGTDVPYARFHQDGTRSMPSRKIVFVPPFFATVLAQKVARHIVYGDGSGAIGTLSLLKRSF